MKLTTKSEYALLSLIYLAKNASSTLVSGEDIARNQQIPLSYMRQILLTLIRANLVHSTKGQSGGYKLAKPANQITLAEVVRLFDGALAPTSSSSKYFYETSPIEKEEKVSAVFKEVRDYLANKLENTTIADVI